MGLRTWTRKAWRSLRRRLSGIHFEEDFIRVYPDDVAFSHGGKRREPTVLDRNNYLNHRKFYRFVGQFAKGKRIADIGCGAGYGCGMMLDAGAAEVWGADASDHALAFAQEHYGNRVRFHQQDIVNLNQFAAGGFDVTVCSEVLEHIKEYGKADLALAELARITAPGGLVIIGTPNSELLGDHGFWFHEIDALFAARFKRYVIFENALEPFGDRRAKWDERRAAGNTGVIVSQDINLDETVLFEGQRDHVRIKQGRPPQSEPHHGVMIDTTLLHNTHSWVVVAIRD